MVNYVTNQAFSGIVFVLSSQPLAIAAGCFCAIPVIESAIRAIADLSDLYNNIITERSIVGEEAEQIAARNELKSKRIKIKNELIHHAFTATFLGICAANPLTGASVVGALGFLVYAKMQWTKQQNFNHPSRVTQVTGFALKVLFLFKKEIFKGILKISQSIGIGIYHVVQKIIAAIKQIGHGINVGAKAIVKGFKAVVLAPIKFVARAGKVVAKISGKAASIVGKIGKVAVKAFVHHPLIGLGVVVGGVVLVVGLMHAGLIASAVGMVASAVGSVAKGAFYVGEVVLGAIPQVAMKFFSLLGSALGPVCSMTWTVVSYIPTTLYHIFSGIVNVARFILRI